MWIVRLALRRPYTFVVMALVIVILGVLATLRMPTDIFPEINIPVASVIWSYGGISPEEMAEVITIRCERAFTTSVNDIEHMESQSLPGIAIIKIFFQPNAKIEAAVAQLAASSQSVLHSLPQGIFPPSILRYSPPRTSARGWRYNRPGSIRPQTARRAASELRQSWLPR